MFSFIYVNAKPEIDEWRSMLYRKLIREMNRMFFMITTGYLQSIVQETTINMWTTIVLNLINKIKSHLFNRV